MTQSPLPPLPPEAAQLRPLGAALLLALGEEGAGPSLSLPRLAKQLGQGVSVLLRELTLMGDAVLAGRPGPGWVQVAQLDGHWRVQLTPAGAALAQLLQAHLAED